MPRPGPSGRHAAPVRHRVARGAAPWALVLGAFVAWVFLAWLGIRVAASADSVLSWLLVLVVVVAASACLFVVLLAAPALVRRRTPPPLRTRTFVPTDPSLDLQTGLSTDDVRRDRRGSADVVH